MTVPEQKLIISTMLKECLTDYRK